MFFFSGQVSAFIEPGKIKDFNTFNFQRTFVEKWPLSARFHMGIIFI